MGERESADTFGPIGPWLVHPRQVPDPQNLGFGWRWMVIAIRTVNCHHGLRCPHLVSYISGS